MHTLFFGGISQYYDDNGVLTRDDNVPFVNTIARVTRDKNGKMSEYKLQHSMPGLLGSGAEFLLAEGMPVFENGVLNLDELQADTTHVGYIYGGINSSARNIFFINTGSQSRAESRIFKVFLVQNTSTSTDNLNLQSQDGLGMMVYPNPGNGIFSVKFELKNQSDVTLDVHDISGKLVQSIQRDDLAAGKHDILLSENFTAYSILVFTLRVGDRTAVQKVIMK
jgi:hypothetical protein